MGTIQDVAANGFAAAHAFAVGEEVVVRLAGLTAHHVDEARELPVGCLPAWTIAVVVARTEVEGEAHYALRFRRHGGACICLAPESAIEGVA